MESHVKILAVLYIVLGAMGAIAALVCLLVLGGTAGIVGMAAHHEPEGRIAVPILGALAVVLFIFFLALSVPGIVAGVGLLKFRPWARILAIILSVLSLVNVPVGTAVGVYGLWVLLSSQAERLFTESSGGP